MIFFWFNLSVYLSRLCDEYFKGLNKKTESNKQFKESRNRFTRSSAKYAIIAHWTGGMCLKMCHNSLVIY